jgi:hypothetical protein
MAKVLHPTCTGLFYPSETLALRADVDRFLAEAPVSTLRPQAIIAPHAGYAYSGPIAGAAYRCVQNVAAQVNRVVLLGTCHVAGVRGLATTSAEAIATPLGEVTVDQAGVQRVRAIAGEGADVTVDDTAHREDHALAVQLPFLRVVLGEFSVIPFLVGPCPTDRAADVLDAVCVDGESLRDDTLIVVSTDLSHYLDYETACRMDRATADAIVALEPDHLDGPRTCGYVAAGGLIHFARRHGLRASLLDLRNSGDTAGSRDRVVGYGAFAFE